MCLNSKKTSSRSFKRISRKWNSRIKQIAQKRFLGKATCYHDHYMINMDSQRPKIDGN